MRIRAELFEIIKTGAHANFPKMTPKAFANSLSLPKDFDNLLEDFERVSKKSDIEARKHYLNTDPALFGQEFVSLVSNNSSEMPVIEIYNSTGRF